MRVLVIEDDPGIAGVVADLLADEGHATGGAATAAEGLARARAEPWDACLTDGFWPEVVAESRAYLADLAATSPTRPPAPRPVDRTVGGRASRPPAC